MLVSNEQSVILFVTAALANVAAVGISSSDSWIVASSIASMLDPWTLLSCFIVLSGSNSCLFAQHSHFISWDISKSLLV